MRRPAAKTNARESGNQPPACPLPAPRPDPPPPPLHPHPPTPPHPPALRSYWFAQGTMFWALFVVGHDCGHQSFSNNKALNDFVGNIVHSSICVPYHGWRISHRTHHANHGARARRWGG